MLTEEIRELFEEVLSAYISSASDVIQERVFDVESDDEYDTSSYKYEVSRINTKAEEWRKELGILLDGK
jgi:hypothetical protein